MERKEEYPFGTREHQKKTKPYGHIDISQRLFGAYKEKRTESVMHLNRIFQGLENFFGETYYSKELESSEKFETIKVIRTLYRELLSNKKLEGPSINHFWRILKKAELRNLPKIYDKEFKNLTGKGIELEGHALLSLTLIEYAKTRERGYLQAISTALKENDFLISEIDRLKSQREVLAASMSIKSEIDLIGQIRADSASRPYPYLPMPRIVPNIYPLTIKSLGILSQESNRTKAYLQTLIKANYFPNFVILIKSEKKEDLDTPPIEKRKLFFNPDIPESKSLEDAKINYKIINADSCEDPQVLEELNKREESYFIYSGKQILKKVFERRKNFIHVHPGKLPEYRGSTCNFYSVLAGEGWHCTSFLMAAGIDSGDILHTKEFPLPGRDIDDSRIYDPYCRALVLAETVRNLAERGKLNSRKQELGKGIDYYIIHPVLRFIRKEYLDNAPETV